MAELDQLIKAVSDSDLRTQLEAEVSALKNQTRFGLVYERHLPETVIVGDTDGLRVGDHVRPREHADDDEDYRVVKLDAQGATILSLKTGKEVTTTPKNVQESSKGYLLIFNGRMPPNNMEIAKNALKVIQTKDPGSVGRCSVSKRANTRIVFTHTRAFSNKTKIARNSPLEILNSLRAHHPSHLIIQQKM